MSSHKRPRLLNNLAPSDFNTTSAGGLLPVSFIKQIFQPAKDLTWDIGLDYENDFCQLISFVPVLMTYNFLIHMLARLFGVLV